MLCTRLHSTTQTNYGGLCAIDLDLETYSKSTDILMGSAVKENRIN